MRRFGQRTYRVLYAFGRAANHPLHCRDSWARLLPSLDALVALAKRGPAHVRAVLGDTVKHKRRTLSRLAWGHASHAKWTRDCEAPNAKNIQFDAMTLWAPPLPVCVKETAGPDVYMELIRVVDDHESFLVAVADDLANADTERHLTKLARACNELMADAIVIRTERWFGRMTAMEFDLPLDEFFGEVLRAFYAGGQRPLRSLPGRWRPAVIDV